MAIIGFIFMFLLLCYLTFALVGSVYIAGALTGTISKGQQLFTLIAGVILGLGWYWLFHDVTISVGGIG